VRVADYVQRRRATLAREGDGAFDQQSPDALPPHIRFDEKAVELGAAVVARQDHGESDDRAVALGHEDMPAGDLLERQSNRVRVREQDVAIVWIGERRAPLQPFERLLFRLDRTPDDDHVRFSHVFRVPGNGDVDRLELRPFNSYTTRTRDDNHAWSHMDLHANSADTFERDILGNEATLRSYMGDLDWRWFRFPYLREGDTPEKYAAVRAFLAEHRYRVAQVTISFHDYAYNAPYARCAASANREGLKFLEENFLAGAAESLVRGRDAALRTVGRDIDHVMLLHIGAFQTVMLPRLLELLREKQFAIIGLQEAQADKAYETPPRRPGPRLGTFLDQIEIDPPKPAAESGDLFARLNALCADPVQPRSR
jgi:hypothetical protein